MLNDENRSALSRAERGTGAKRINGQWLAMANTAIAAELAGPPAPRPPPVQLPPPVPWGAPKPAPRPAPKPGCGGCGGGKRS